VKSQVINRENVYLKFLHKFLGRGSYCLKIRSTFSGRTNYGSQIYNKFLGRVYYCSKNHVDWNNRCHKFVAKINEISFQTNFPWKATKSQEFCQKSLALVLHSTVVHRIPQKLLCFLWGSKMDKKELHCIKNRVEQF